MSGKNTKSAPKSERLIYCGPNIPGGILQRYTVYKGGLPSHLGELFEKCPAVKRLFVSVEDLARVETAIATKGTPEHSAFQEVLQFTMKGGA
ncbi:hypothetical protein ciss_07390 [Carboxydothermus islandicus]|uniref:Uncharacterized protein n=1 Tax=Carboxydothermus islandicus TaxID=661089 RepID=A0A1L8D0T8_9THEO|nr:hypothetical protein [Carboxydothermus islandicus]GAV24806.1 hypothetical protein ciss_07390 [Carboxydothermus islandicus]